MPPETKPTPLPPEINQTPNEAELLHQLEQGILPCPCCGQPLEGAKVVIEGIYEGVLVSCSDISDCGFMEG